MQAIVTVRIRGALLLACMHGEPEKWDTIPANIVTELRIVSKQWQITGDAEWLPWERIPPDPQVLSRQVATTCGSAGYSSKGTGGTLSGRAPFPREMQ